ncbi:hypothetical protein [Branchiibius hedensis]|uniref:hypothetical protein n=1 Tax=Branchiibius hedensis TaxID=672460 RepID=UPI0011B25F55|nr:hypothetical protein [Branchiibius hedensis]
MTARMDPAVAAAIASIADDAWTPIQYPNAVYHEEQDVWVSDAEVAEVPFTAFTSRTKDQHVACRLIVRRVQRIQPLAGDRTAQGELFATYRHHAFITNSRLQIIEADQRHRDHAIIEQVIAELKNGPLAHLPSGKYTANAAWVACAVIAFNLARATAIASCMRLTRWATVRARDHQPARPDRDHRAATDPAPTRALAVDTGLGSALGHRDRDPAHPHQQRSDHPARPGATPGHQWKSRADRRASHAPTRNPLHGNTIRTFRSTTVDQGSVAPP